LVAGAEAAYKNLVNMHARRTDGDAGFSVRVGGSTRDRD
jgi:hypothetical protein